MKFFTPTALLAAALLSVVVTLPFVPSATVRLFSIEITLSSTVDSTFQLFYDDGDGFREELSGRVPIAAGVAPAVYRVPVPAGTFRALRIDPLKGPGSVKLVSMRVANNTGRVIAELPVNEIQPAVQIQSIQPLPQRGVEITTAAKADDPQCLLATPFAVSGSWTDGWRASLPYILPVFGVLALLLLLIDRARRFQERALAAGRAQTAHPARAVIVVAAIAAVASAYPVVFLGKSYVSPNLGTPLLYDEFPTLPGYDSRETTDVKLSDIGAVIWQHVPFSMMQGRALAQGELPLWNRYNALGVPLLAQGQSMFGDPLHFLVIAFNGAAWAWDIKYVVAKWLFAAGLGLTVLALVNGPRDQGTKGPKDLLASAAEGPLVPWSLGPLVPAVMVAFATPFIGFFLYRINHPAFFSVCYAPWPLFCLVRFAQAATRRAAALWATGLVAANFALMNSGTVKEAYMLLLTVNFSGACIVLATAASWRERLAKLGGLAWAGLLFALITAPVWLTFLDTLANAYTGYNAVSAYQIQPTLLLAAFDEIFYRPLMAQNRVFNPSLNFLLLLGVLYFLATLRVQFANRAAIALAASSLLPLAIAFGLISPQWIVTLPFLGNVAHLDNSFSCGLIILWSVVAGVGYATAAQRLGTREGRHDLVIAGLLLFALVFGWIAFRQAAHRPILGPTFTVHAVGRVLAVPPFIWGYLVALLLAAAALALAARGGLLRRSCSSARGLVLVTCVIVMLWRHGLHASSAGFEDFVAQPTERVDLRARSDAMQLARVRHRQEPIRGYGLHGNFFPGWTGVYGLETIHGPDALVNPFVRELMGVSGVERLWDWRMYADASTVANARPFFDALNVRLYFDRGSDQGALGQVLKLVQPADLDVYESPTAWPRAYFVDRIEAYDEVPALVQRIRRDSGAPFASVQQNDKAAQAAVARISRDPGGAAKPATSYKLTENTTSFTVQASGPGVIVLLEAFWPGDFRAEVNGRTAPVLRVNHAFKGVVVDAAGEYRVTFRYWPRNFTRNLLLCLAGAVLLAGSLALALRPARAA